MPFLHGESEAIDIYYEEWGTGVPVVLVGGLTSTVETWGRQVEALASAHRVICPDNRGSGRTRLAADDGVRTPERFAGDVVTLLDGVGLERVHLVGASLGGMIVQEVALRHPQRLLSLTIACSTHGGREAVPASAEVLQALLAGSAGDASAEARRAALGVVFDPSSFAEHSQAVDFYQQTKEAWPHSAEEVERRRQGLLTFDSRERLAGLRLPTLVLTGAGDVLIPAANSRLLAERIPGAELALVEDAGHVFFVERPEETNRILLDFFARHPPPDGS